MGGSAWVNKTWRKKKGRRVERGKICRWTNPRCGGEIYIYIYRLYARTAFRCKTRLSLSLSLSPSVTTSRAIVPAYVRSHTLLILWFSAGQSFQHQFRGGSTSELVMVFRITIGRFLWEPKKNYWIKYRVFCYVSQIFFDDTGKKPLALWLLVQGL